MTSYVKVPLAPSGIAEMRGSMQIVEDRMDATEVLCADADYLQKQAQQEWPGLDWRIEKIDGTKYIVRGDATNHYILRAFCGEREVIASTVAVVPSANSYPGVGQIIDGKWKITEVLPSPTGEHRVRVTPI